jgi:hypothetical protein
LPGRLNLQVCKLALLRRRAHDACQCVAHRGCQLIVVMSANTFRNF